jgi:hypothetical protein
MSRRQELNDDGSAYGSLMAKVPPATIGPLFERGRPNAPGIHGGPQFVERLASQVRSSGAAMSLDEITELVARAHDVPRSQLLSKSRQRELVMARARIACYATKRCVTSLSGVARYLSRRVSALFRAITRHRLRHPELFTFHAFSKNIPTVPLVGATSIVRGSAAALLPDKSPDVHYRSHGDIFFASLLTRVSGTGVTGTWRRDQLLRRLASRHAQGLIFAFGTLPPGPRLDRMLEFSRLVAPLDRCQSVLAAIQRARLRFMRMLSPVTMAVNWLCTNAT